MNRRAALAWSLTLLSAAPGCSSNDSGPKDGGGQDAGSQLDATPDSGTAGRDRDAAEFGHNVPTHHLHASRDGRYDEPTFSLRSVAGLKRDTSFDGTISGNVYAQPLYIEDGPAGKSLIIAVTESNNVYALDATGGTVVWQKNVGSPVPLSKLPCGNIDPLGITGTPVVDLPSRTLFFDAMTTPDGGTTKKHKIFALNVDTGDTKQGWPVDVDAAASFRGTRFDSSHQNQRGALSLIGGRVYVPYGAHYGDCPDYRGWVVGVPIDDPAGVVAWATSALGGGAWAPGGVASDGTNGYFATGNTFRTATWGGGEAIIRFQPGPMVSEMTADYWAPQNWKVLDDGDSDLGGSGPILVDVEGATPSRLVVSMGKDGNAYLLDRARLGGIAAPVAKAPVATNEIIVAAASYATPTGTYVVFKGDAAGCPRGSGDLGAFSITAQSPPAIRMAWCANQNGLGSPFVTTSTSSVIVWGIGAEGDQRLRGFDGDTGTVVFNGGGAMERMAGTRRYNTGIVARGRIFYAADNRVYAFKP